MNFLLLSEDDAFNKVIEQSIQEKETSAKIYTSEFSVQNVKKIKKYFDKISLCIMYSEKPLPQDIITALSYTTGYSIANDIIVLTNIKELQGLNAFSKNSFKYLKTKDDIISYVKSQYEEINIVNTKRLAKKKLLSKGIPFTSDCFGTYIGKNKTEICKLFISGGIDINSKDENGTPMLNIAVRNDNEDFVKLLLSLGAEINCVSEDRGYTPVMDAVWRGNKEITELLIKKGAELNTINKEGQTNLVLAVGADRVEIVKLLADNGADPDVKDMMGMSAYGYASLFRKERILEILKPYHKE